MTSTGDPRLTVDGLGVTFNPGRINETRALDGVDLHVQDGQFVVIVGSNGAGKSTLLNTIAGAIIPDEGRIGLNGDDVTEQPEHRRARSIGRVFQDPLLGTAGPMTIEENLVLAGGRSGRRRLSRPGRRDEHRELVATLGMGLEDRLDSRVDSLSGGQRQALAVLMALQSSPSLLLLDEHTAALDPAMADRVLGVTEELAGGRRITTIMITHNMSHAISVGDRVLMFHRGRVLFDVAGDERDRLGVDDLVERFRTLSGDGLGDRAVLS